uniref:Uncharacterized protein n=1 Tax=Arundo donax TaxID=35708 RepID=A0A0A9E5V2_ARUDO
MSTTTMTLRKSCIVNGPSCSWSWRRCYTWKKSSKALTFKTSSGSCPTAKQMYSAFPACCG